MTEKVTVSEDNDSVILRDSERGLLLLIYCLRRKMMLGADNVSASPRVCGESSWDGEWECGTSG